MTAPQGGGSHSQPPADARPSLRTLGFESFSSRYERLRASAARHGIADHDMVLPAEGVVRNSLGMRLHYLEWPLHPDCPSGPAVILLHGGGLHAHTFDLVGNLLRRHARCIAIDLRGHGDSDWAAIGGYGSSAIADDIESAIEALDVRQVVVAGHSLGGLAALVWASRRPPELAGLIILDVAPGMNLGNAASFGNFITTAPTFADLDEVDDFVAAAFPGRTSGGDGMAANLRWDDSGRLGFKHDARQFADAALILGDDLRQVVRGITCPTRILRGARSVVISAQAAAELAELIVDATWAEIPDAGHTIQSSNPVAVAVEVGNFLVGLTGTTGDTKPTGP